jgi:hypothetical protein
MKPPPLVVGLVSKTCDLPPPPPPLLVKKEKFNRKGPFPNYIKKKTPHPMSKSNAIF